ncbi:MAG: putative ribonuclease [Candidatus Solibacter sp.]|nr:putative ribonuclease [Candidatus Solibacter sp.]
MRAKNLWSIFRKTIAAWNEHEAPTLGAALAFYTLLSLAPLLIIVVAITAMALGHSSAQDQIIAQAQGMIGEEGANAIRGMITHSQKPASGGVASVLGVLTLLFGASGVFAELRGALNKMWDVKPAPGGGFRETVKERLFSFGMVLAVGFLLLVSLVVSAWLAMLGKFFGGILPVPEFVLNVVNFVVSLAGIAVLFALIYKYVPQRKIEWRDVWGGAFATAFFFTVGKFLIGLYLGKAAVGSPYGAAGSLVVVIVWVYYSAMIFLFGAEFTRMLTLAKEEQPQRVRRPASGLHEVRWEGR